MGGGAAQRACTGGVRLEVRGRAGAERTVNVCSMLVTLIMLKLSGWLKSSAFCRVARAGIRSRARGAGGGVGGCAVRGMHREGLGCGGRGEGAHTLNILFMFTTFDVSRFSGWLKADAPCRVARGRAYEAEECAGREGGERVVAGRLRC